MRLRQNLGACKFFASAKMHMYYYALNPANSWHINLNRLAIRGDEIYNSENRFRM